MKKLCAFALSPEAAGRAAVLTGEVTTMKFVFAPDSFKGTLSSGQIISILERKARIYFPDAETAGVLIADGGEGTLDAVMQAVNGVKKSVRVRNPLNEPVNARYLIWDDKRALIEMAEASGLTLIPYREGNALFTTSYGTGELIRDALDAGADEITISVGGSATNDGGIGLLAALGAEFLDKDGVRLEPVGKNLIDIERIEITGMHKRINKVKFTVMCDVTNPLLGAHGATYTFGPQKGANRKQLDFLEKGMQNYASKIKALLGTEADAVPGGGAAGGAGAALAVFCAAAMKSGIDTILELIGFEDLVADADLIITGEGRIDDQSVHGKVLDGIGKYAKKRRIPLIAIAGSMDTSAENLYRCGIGSIMVAPDKPMTLSCAMEHAPELLEDAIDRMFRFLKIGGELGSRQLKKS